MFRVIYDRVFKDSKEAAKAAKSVSELSPMVTDRCGSYFVELGRYKTRQDADSAYAHYRAQGLRVFIQKLEDK